MLVAVASYSIIKKIIKKSCVGRDMTTIWKFAYERASQTVHFHVIYGFVIDPRKHGSVAL